MQITAKTTKGKKTAEKRIGHVNGDYIHKWKWN
jgi:hypothetical protein